MTRIRAGIQKGIKRNRGYGYHAEVKNETLGDIHLDDRQNLIGCITLLIGLFVGLAGGVAVTVLAQLLWR